MNLNKTNQSLLSKVNFVVFMIVIIVVIGVRLPKSLHQWPVANDFFMAEFSNKSISSTGLNDIIKEFNLVSYTYFKDTCGSVDSTHNKELSAKSSSSSSVFSISEVDYHGVVLSAFCLSFALEKFHLQPPLYIFTPQCSRTSSSFLSFHHSFQQIPL